MPSKLSMVIGVIVTAGIFTGGAYLASKAEVDPESQAIADEENRQYYESINGDGSESSSSAAPNNTVQLAENAENGTTGSPTEISANDSSNENVSNESAAESETSSPSTNGIEVTIEGIRNDKGRIYVFVFDKKSTYDAYDVNKVAAYAERGATTDPLTLSFPKATKGPYAISIFHDENDDQELNLDSNGYPVEGYGTSNAKSSYDQLNFKKASVMPGKITVRMFYL